MSRHVALYARVAVQDQADTPAMAQQLERLHTYARERGWLIAPEQVYRDEGVSGARLDRPGLDRLRATIARGEVHTLLVTRPDRLARSEPHLARLLKECDRFRCRAVFIDWS